MRHRVAHRKLGRVTEHRISLLRNQAAALLRHEHIRTTVPKARELRPFVERLITIAKRGLASGEAVKTMNARRLVGRDIPDDTVVSKLFETIAPRFEERPGGYTRLLKVGPRRGDNAEVAQIELVGSEYNPNLEAGSEEGQAAEKTTGVGGRLRAAARRLRGDKKPSAQSSAAEGEASKPPRASRKKKESGE